MPILRHVVASVTSPAQGLAGWLASARPKGAVTLALSAAGVAGEELVQRWAAEELGTTFMDAAQMILLTAQSDCDARCEPTSYVATWEDATYRGLANRPIPRLRPVMSSIEQAEAGGPGDNPMTLVWEQLLRLRAKEHALNHQLVTTLLVQQRELLAQIAAERQEMARLLLESLRGGAAPAAAGEESLEAQVRAASLQKLADVATDTLVPILGKAAERHLLAPPKAAKAAKKPNGKAAPS
jgi:hypothetical protein